MAKVLEFKKRSLSCHTHVCADRDKSKYLQAYTSSESIMLECSKHGQDGIDGCGRWRYISISALQDFNASCFYRKRQGLAVRKNYMSSEHLLSSCSRTQPGTIRLQKTTLEEEFVFPFMGGGQNWGNTYSAAWRFPGRTNFCPESRKEEYARASRLGKLAPLWVSPTPFMCEEDFATFIALGNNGLHKNTISPTF